MPVKMQNHQKNLVRQKIVAASQNSNCAHVNDIIKSRNSI